MTRFLAAILSAHWPSDLRAGAILVIVLLLTACAPEPVSGPRCQDADYLWSATEPSINLRHIFCGDTNRRGYVVGFHSTLALGRSGVPAIVDGTVEPAEPTGVFTADIRFPDGRTKFSTFFPDSCGETEIVASILHAAAHAEPTEPWGFAGSSAPGPASGPEDDGGYCLAHGAPFPIRFGYLGEDRSRINTAFPQ